MSIKIKRGTPIGEFAIEEEVSDDGGMSRVFLASHKDKSNHKVAVKITRPDDPNSHTFQDLLRRETESLNALRHPGIVRIYPISDGRRRTTYTARFLAHSDRPWYFIMEYLPYGTLDEKTNLIQKMPLEWGIELFYQLVTTVHFMHRSGYAHLDLKPQNVLFREKPDPRQTPKPVLVDFGSVAKRGFVEQLTASMRYSPPEVLIALQHEGPFDHLQAEKVDIWALGVMLFEIVTGRVLFDQRGKNAITTTVLSGELKSLADNRRGYVDPSLDIVLAQMLNKNPDKRPSTGQVIRAIEEKIQSVRPPRIAV